MNRADRTYDSDRRGHQTRQRLLLTLLTLGLLAVSLKFVAFSGASFVDTSTNPRNAFAAGNLRHTNSRSGELILNASALRPGQSRSETVTLSGGGDLTGAYTISRSSLDDPSGLAGVLILRIDNVSAGTTLFNGTSANLSTVPAGTIGPQESRTYRFTLSYPVGSATSQQQGAALSMTIQFTGVTR